MYGVEMTQAQRDLITYVVLLLTMGGLYLNAASIPDSMFEPVGGRFLAQLIPAFVSALCIFGLVYNHLTGADQDGAKVGALTLSGKMFALLFAYAFGLTLGGGLTGFVIVSAVFVIALSWVLYEGDRPSIREVIWVVGLAVALPLGIGLVFTRLLFVNLP